MNVDNKLRLGQVSNKADLLAKLKSVSIKVPPRGRKGGGRKPYHTEKWCMARLLATLAERNDASLGYPLDLAPQLVRHRGPDFFLTMNKKTIGVEVTELIPEDFAKAIAMRNVIDPDACLPLTYFKRGHRQSTNNIKKIIKGERRYPPPWTGDEVERDWACDTMDRIADKAEKLNDYDPTDDVWLYIPVNFSGGLLESNGGLNGAMKYLNGALSKSDGCEKQFSRIFIEVCSEIIEIQSKSIERYAINNLWR